MTDLQQLLGAFAPPMLPKKRAAEDTGGTLANPASMLGARATATAAERQDAQGPYAALMHAMSGMDPLMQAVAQSSIEDALKLPRGSIPSPQEYSLQQLQFQEQTYARHKALLIDKTNDVQASIADMPDEMKAKLQLDEDTLTKDPKRWVAYARAIGSDLSAGDLMRAGMLKTPDELKKAALKEQDDATQRATAANEAAVEPSSALRRELENLKALNVGTSKTPALIEQADFKGQAEAAIKAQGDAQDTDLMPSKYQFWTGPDANSLQGLERAYMNEGRQIASPLLKPLAARGFLGAAGEQIGRVLKDAPKGRIKTAQGDQMRVLVNDPATLHAANLAFMLAQDSGMDISSVLTKIGVDANAIDTDSFEAARKALSGGQ